MNRLNPFPSSNRSTAARSAPTGSPRNPASASARTHTKLLASNNLAPPLNMLTPGNASIINHNGSALASLDMSNISAAARSRVNASRCF